MAREYTPENITHLEPDDIFVFGSNLEGMHMGGAARVAYERFGAKWGQVVGPQGQSYAIPTMQGVTAKTKNMMRVSLSNSDSIHVVIKLSYPIFQKDRSWTGIRN